MVVCFHCHKALLINSMLSKTLPVAKKTLQNPEIPVIKYVTSVNVSYLEIVNTKADVVDINLWSSCYSGNLNSRGICSEQYFEKVCLLL